MQRFFTLFLLSFFFQHISAQVRYKDELFTITKHADIEYGSNYDNKNQLTHLLMDVYEPESDTARLRPLIVFVHGGSFIGGDRGDQAINRTAEYFARKGYVTANIEYRVQQTTIINPVVDFADVYQWHRAIVRATQDLKAAIRYFKKDAATNNNYYKIDTNTIFIYGSSAGAITALHTVYLDDTTEMNTFFKNSYRELGGLEGNSGNSGYASTKGVKAVVSCSGAIADLNYMNNNKDIQYLGFHNNPDLTVPYGQGCFVTVACWLGQFYGDSKVFQKIKSNGTYAEFYPVNQLGHPVDQVSDTASHRMILQKTTDFLYRLVQNTSITTGINFNKSVRAEIVPNPSNGSFKVVLPNDALLKDALLEIFDVQGEIVYREQLAPGRNTLDFQLNLPQGLYVLVVNTAAQTFTAKITVAP